MRLFAASVTIGGIPEVALDLPSNSVKLRAMKLTSSRDATPLDAEIGVRVRARRKQLKLPLRHVAGLIGVSYQQLQKYESGDNRMSATTLTRIAEALAADPSDFLPGKSKSNRGSRNAEQHDALALQLQAAYAKISSTKERRLILDLTRRLGAASEQPTRSRPKRRR